jgi:hypothetical protein
MRRSSGSSIGRGGDAAAAGIASDDLVSRHFGRKCGNGCAKVVEVMKLTEVWVDERLREEKWWQEDEWMMERERG